MQIVHHANVVELEMMATGIQGIILNTLYDSGIFDELYEIPENQRAPHLPQEISKRKYRKITQKYENSNQDRGSHKTIKHSKNFPKKSKNELELELKFKCEHEIQRNSVLTIRIIKIYT